MIRLTMQRFVDYINSYPTIMWCEVGMLLLTIFYLFFLMSASRHLRQKKVYFCFIGLLLISWLTHIYILSQLEPISEKSWFSIISISLISSFELFLGNSRIFDNGFQDFLFKPNHSIWLLLMSSLYLLAICTTGYLIVSIFFKRLSSNIWLLFHRPAKNNYVFWGFNQNTALLAKDILKTGPENKQIIILDAPSQDDENYETSFFSRLRSLSSEKHISLSRKQMRQGTILKFRPNLALSSHKRIFRSIGLPRLSHWFRGRYNTWVFILSDNEVNNQEVLDTLLSNGVRCEGIYCHAHLHRGKIDSLEDTYRHKYQCHVKFIDSAYLSIQSLLKEKEYYDFQPIHFVDLAKVNELNLGFVSSSFTSLIIGFGEFGQCAAGYLYEYASFVGEDFQPTPFLCHVFDPNIDHLSARYSLQHPGIDIEKHFRFHQIEAGTLAFWDFFTRISTTINYVFICTGDDERNLCLAEDLLSVFPSNQRVAIMTKNNQPTRAQLNRIMRLKERFEKSFIIFGEREKLWTYSNVSNVALEREAKAFYEQYSSCSGDSQNWDARQINIRHGDPKSIRQQSQDFANVLHRHTKLTLIGDNVTVRRELEEGICSGERFQLLKKHFITDHSNIDSEYLERLGHYLAVGEHIRWTASHALLGYIYDEKTNDSLKCHSCILPFSSLSDTIQHYDWLVIKTTLLLSENNHTESQTTTNNKSVSIKDETYIPSPLNLEDVKLPDSLMELSELLAKNIHEVWSQNRIRQGWRYGKKRDDVAKYHPDLLPYDQLPEQEKEYDRASSINTIKLILKLNYKIISGDDPDL